ncbi:MAG: hypothetical protein NTY19_51360, partial [Planctomycetota bacterium]|nr:hypothetical protein [Planctomycetota bacterium]
MESKIGTGTDRPERSQSHFRGNAVNANDRNIIVVDRWGIEQPAPKMNGSRARKIAANPPAERVPNMRKIRAAHALGRRDIHAKYDLAQTTV